MNIEFVVGSILFVIGSVGFVRSLCEIPNGEFRWIFFGLLFGLVYAIGVALMLFW